MELDWSTFLLEIVNFLVLVWILQHFFYRPVRQAIDRRQQAIEKSLAEARAAHAEADTLKAQYESRLSDWEAVKQTAQGKLQAEIAEEKKWKMETFLESLEAQKEKSRALEEKRQADILRKNEQTAMQQAAQFAAKFLARVSNQNTNDRLAEIFVADLSNLPEEKRAELQRACTANPYIHVISAFSLGKQQQEAVTQSLDNMAGKKLSYAFSIDPQVIAGIRVNMGACVLHANIQDELQFFAEGA